MGYRYLGRPSAEQETSVKSTKQRQSRTKEKRRIRISKEKTTTLLFKDAPWRR